MRPAVPIALSLLCVTLLLPFAAAQAGGASQGSTQTCLAWTLDGVCVAFGSSDFLCRPDIEPYCELPFCLLFGPYPCLIP